MHLSLITIQEPMFFHQKAAAPSLGIPGFHALSASIPRSLHIPQSPQMSSEVWIGQSASHYAQPDQKY